MICATQCLSVEVLPGSSPKGTRSECCEVQPCLWQPFGEHCISFCASLRGWASSDIFEWNMKTTKLVKGRIGVYHTLGIRRQSVSTFGCVCGVKPAFPHEVPKRLMGQKYENRTLMSQSFTHVFTLFSARRIRWIQERWHEQLSYWGFLCWRFAKWSSQTLLKACLH